MQSNPCKVFDENYGHKWLISEMTPAHSNKRVFLYRDLRPKTVHSTRQIGYEYRGQECSGGPKMRVFSPLIC